MNDLYFIFSSFLSNSFLRTPVASSNFSQSTRIDTYKFMTFSLKCFKSNSSTSINASFNSSQASRKFFFSLKNVATLMYSWTEFWAESADLKYIPAYGRKKIMSLYSLKDFSCTPQYGAFLRVWKFLKINQNSIFKAACASPIA